ncbi:ATP-binding protein [Paraburkholderia sp. SEWSISQ10-3 4]|uniref:sensor histidine kinase n=1 Tax=Paraburkholderia TaxID=1822464 RepID=UPI00224F40ED|nr:MULTISPECIES: ATP-binding protein [Paraburkholderia]MCX4139343.1 ATP-binding protein [Paraburkholderia aspalathi]MDN7172031.1 ATP-binding protein [Paraburkholderia sp. SEWSISQ10-3 4]MDQ6501670.1 ATP-binding protein [Paraburkholderia aspalathi]
MSNDADQLVAALKGSLAAETLDAGAIFELASRLALTESDRVRFSVDAGLINRLGLELVSKQETAVAELIKNAYDADAVTVDLVFKNTAKVGGTLEIIDNGLGMTRDQLINGFMRLSTNDKGVNPTSEKYFRRRAGKKGIGRFSAQRLGRKLTVQTRRDGDSAGLQVTIDWDVFAPGTDLIFIENKIEVINKASSGTTLIIENLRDSWGEDQVTTSFRYVSTLQAPFPIAPVVTHVDADPGFNARFFWDDGEDLVTAADAQKDILDHALATVTGRVDDSGHAFYSIKCSRFDINIVDRPIGPDREDGNQPYKYLKSISFSAAYFILATELLPRGMFSNIRSVLDKQGGIRVYRNGFRVLPYGEPFDDWLRLERSSSLREILPPHRNNNFLGYVRIDDADGKVFEETASREGLVENDAYKELRDFVFVSLTACAKAIAEKRGKKIYAGDPRPVRPREPDESPADRVQRAMGALRTEASVLPPPLVDDLEQGINELVSERSELVSEVEMLRVLASLGLSIGEFTHEIRHNLVALSADAASVVADLPANSSAHVVMKRLTENVATLRGYARYFDEAIAENAQRNVTIHEIRDVLNSFEEKVGPTAERAGIKLQISVEGYDLFTKPMHHSEWASILLNLYSNSIKAIRRASADGIIDIRAGAQDGNIFVEFSDNGDGIPLENRSRIFDAFFTTSSPPPALAGANEEALGAGLGLKITRDIVQSHQGSITLVAPPQGYQTCFRIEVRQATEEEFENADEDA